MGFTQSHCQTALQTTVLDRFVFKLREFCTVQKKMSHIPNIAVVVVNCQTLKITFNRNQPTTGRINPNIQLTYRVDVDIHSNTEKLNCRHSFDTWNTGERGGSVVECRTPEREVRGSRPTAAVLCPWARHFTPRKYWLITQEAMAPSRHDWKIVDWDVKPQHNQPTNLKHWNWQPLRGKTPQLLITFRHVYTKELTREVTA